MSNTASISARLGNLFDGPTDLIVLPCSTAGTITGFVARALVSHSIPRPRSGMQLGEIEITPFVGADNIAQYVAFAASVAGVSSNTRAIHNIAANLGKFTQCNRSVRRVSVPLLGTGAGGLVATEVAEALKRGFLAEAVPTASLVINVLDQKTYDQLRNERRARPGNSKTVRVFISHTSKSQDAIKWVETLAGRLMEQGIEARLDRFHLRKGMDLAQWMCNELAMAQKVLVICDEAYRERADARLGGVGWETMLIQGDMAQLPVDSTKYQIIARGEELNRSLPMYLKTRYAFHAPTPEIDELLVKELVHELQDMPCVPQYKLQEVAL